MGEGELDFKFSPAGGQFHLRGSDEALTPYGGLVGVFTFCYGAKFVSCLFSMCCDPWRMAFRKACGPWTVNDLARMEGSNNTN